MLTLVLDSCTERSVVAIVQDNQCQYLAGLPLGLHNSRYLLPKVEEGFEHLGLHPKKLDYITVGAGPGSYTGIRLGATIAKSLSYSCAIPLVGICTLEGFVPESSGPFAAMIDAKMAGVYLLKGARADQEISYQSPPEIVALEDLGEKLVDDEVIIGPYFERLQGKILEMYPNLKCRWRETAPDPLQLARRALVKFENEDYSLDGTLKLLYMRE